MNKIYTHPFSRYRRILAFLVLLPILLWGSRANAQEELSFVYGTNHFNGATFSSTFVPPSVDTFYLIADHTNMIASRFTQVYYWPLTNEEKANWDEANLVVEGELEILQNNTLLDTITLTDYVIQYDAVDHINSLQLYLGEEAGAARQNFEDMQTQYREDLYRYYEEMNVYREEFAAALEELAAGTITEDEMPQPPAPQQDLTLFSTNLLVGFPLNLPEGSYQVQLRLPDGTIQPNSQKKLVVFSPIQDGIGYNVFSQERWTAPEESLESNETIYTLPGTKLYFEPFYQIQFNELFYTRMNNPQDTQARRDRNIWVPFDYLLDAQLEIKTAGQSTQNMEEQAYYVRQIAGSALGYEIVLYDPDTIQEATFSGFEVELNTAKLQIALVDEDGTALPFSQREIRSLYTQNAPWVYVLSSLPLAAGLAAILIRKKSVNDSKTHYLDVTR